MLAVVDWRLMGANAGALKLIPLLLASKACAEVVGWKELVFAPDEAPAAVCGLEVCVCVPPDTVAGSVAIRPIVSVLIAGEMIGFNGRASDTQFA